jgi:hypothetical protein
MEKENIHGLMADLMKVNIKKTRRKVLEYISSKTVESTKVTGRMGSNMVLEYTAKEKSIDMEFGVMGRDRNGLKKKTSRNSRIGEPNLFNLLIQLTPRY